MLYAFTKDIQHKFTLYTPKLGTINNTRIAVGGTMSASSSTANGSFRYISKGWFPNSWGPLGHYPGWSPTLRTRRAVPKIPSEGRAVHGPLWDPNLGKWPGRQKRHNLTVCCTNSHVNQRIPYGLVRRPLLTRPYGTSSSSPVLALGPGSESPCESLHLAQGRAPSGSLSCSAGDRAQVDGISADANRGLGDRLDHARTDQDIVGAIRPIFKVRWE